MVFCFYLLFVHIYIFQIVFLPYRLVHRLIYMYYVNWLRVFIVNAWCFLPSLSEFNWLDDLTQSTDTHGSHYFQLLPAISGFSLVVRDTCDSRHVMTKGHVINKKHRYDRYFKQFSWCKMNWHNTSPLISSDEIDIRWKSIKLELQLPKSSKNLCCWLLMIFDINRSISIENCWLQSIHLSSIKIIDF